MGHLEQQSHSEWPSWTSVIADENVKDALRSGKRTAREIMLPGDLHKGLRSLKTSPVSKTCAFETTNLEESAARRIMRIWDDAFRQHFCKQLHWKRLTCSTHINNGSPKLSLGQIEPQTFAGHLDLAFVPFQWWKIRGCLASAEPARTALSRVARQRLQQGLQLGRLAWVFVGQPTSDSPCPPKQ